MPGQSEGLNCPLMKGEVWRGQINDTARYTRIKIVYLLCILSEEVP